MGGESSKYILLKDGRKLGFHQYGDWRGYPIIALHGTPGSRIWFEENDPISLELGIRLITIDRPGYGLSDKKNKRTITCFNSDINELIEKLELKQFSIFGVSGGGAYALAFASINDPNLYKAGMVASVFEFEGGRPPKAMCRPNRIGFFLAKYFPWMLRFNFNQQKKLLEENPDLYIRSSQKHTSHLSTSDREIMLNEDASKSMARHLKEAFRNSAEEAVSELKLLGSSWGFSPSEVKIPIEVWHGTSDTLSPISGLRRYIEKIPISNTHFINEKGHFLDEDPSIWKMILESLKP